MRNVAQIAALILAFAGCVDGFRSVPVRSFAPALRNKNGISVLPSLSLREKAHSSKSVLGLRAAATSPFTQALEKAYADPAVPHCRERMYNIAQARSIYLDGMLNFNLSMPLIIFRCTAGKFQCLERGT